MVRLHTQLSESAIKFNSNLPAMDECTREVPGDVSPLLRWEQGDPIVQDGGPPVKSEGVDSPEQPVGAVARGKVHSALQEQEDDQQDYIPTNFLRLREGLATDTVASENACSAISDVQQDYIPTRVDCLRIDATALCRRESAPSVVNTAANVAQPALVSGSASPPAVVSRQCDDSADLGTEFSASVEVQGEAQAVKATTPPLSNSVDSVVDVLLQHESDMIDEAPPSYEWSVLLAPVYKARMKKKKPADTLPTPPHSPAGSPGPLAIDLHEITAWNKARAQQIVARELARPNTKLNPNSNPHPNSNSHSTPLPLPAGSPGLLAIDPHGITAWNKARAQQIVARELARSDINHQPNTVLSQTRSFKKHHSFFSTAVRLVTGRA
ncbi:hypothetical protein CALCODRAFT_486862 [Calocera cornea HHB12733]|uniref:Uncharacterized protein n=1 Tax=Calocera cornea HHB12733 TaxID=1353952 RepID=A0A165DHH8_9BASI|nr:hypothetical protein CALCODRAFT_486862 [Calocera cornea HHB12733]